MTIRGLLARLREAGPQTIGRIGITLFAAFSGIFWLMGTLGVKINASPSLPIGLYIRSSDPNVNLIEFCPSEPYASFAAARGYRSQGNCPDGASPLMKPVIARAGDVVGVSNRGISVNGRLIPNTAPKRADTQGRPITPWPFGTYVTANGAVWVASSYNRRSFDSRYFGPIPTNSIRTRLRPLLTE